MTDKELAEWISSTYRARRKDRGAILGQMQEITAHVDGDIVVPLPELDSNEKPFVANQIGRGIDSYGQKIASTQPNLEFPALRPGIQPSEKKARHRKQATLGWWEHSRMEMIDYQRARFFVGYGSAPVIIVPDSVHQVPKWRWMNPLTSFPAPTNRQDDLTPPDCIEHFQQPLGWLKDFYPVQANLIRKNNDIHDDAMYDLLRYVDDEEKALVVLGRAKDGYSDASTGSSSCEILERAPNKAGVCPVVVPGRITLGRLAGQFDALTGIYEMRAKLMALEVIAIQRGIFMPTWAIARPGEVVKILTTPEPLQGIPGQIQGGELREMQINPTYLAGPTIDRLERAEKIEGGIVPEMQGESGSNIRTGKRGDFVYGAAVDPQIEEAQKIFAYSRQEENKRAIAIAKGYWPNTTKSIHVSWKGAKGQVTYTPKDTFETDVNVVAYSLPGSDVNNLTVAIGQAVGTGMMSKKTARKMYTLIEDPETEDDQIDVEALQEAFIQGLQTRLSSGEMNPMDAIRIAELRLQGKSIIEAAKIADEEASQRQAEVTPEGQPDMAIPGSPDAQPGLAPPGVGAEIPTIPAPEPSLQNLSQQLFSLRSSGRGA